QAFHRVRGNGRAWRGKAISEPCNESRPKSLRRGNDNFTDESFDSRGCWLFKTAHQEKCHHEENNAARVEDGVTIPDEIVPRNFELAEAVDYQTPKNRRQ